MQKTKIITKLISSLAFILFLFESHAQCPADFTDWSNMTRTTYDGNWLLTENGLNYAANPQPTRTVLLPNENEEGFGLNDYNTDTNFTEIPVALENLPVIRVGKKFNQTGQGELSPIKRAHVATFTFNPTVDNCKIRVHYIGFLQEMSNLSTFYRGGNNGDANGALQRYRRTINSPGTNTTARNAASFGLFCRYEYESNATNLHNLIQPGGTLSRVGRTEFGLSVPNTAVTSFTLPAQNLDYGLNDMFCFSKAGTELRTLPNTGVLNKKMNEWDSYVMDFSEFIGGTVTITLFGATSNYIGETQNHSYCYYQFECLQDTPTSLPVSTLLDIPDMHFGGCLPALPTNIDINLTDTVPTIMGSSINTNSVQQINNGNVHRWLHIPDINARRYHNHFASLRVQFLRNDNVWVNYTQIRDSGTTDNTIADSPDFRINSLPGTPTSIDSLGIMTYTFKVLYSVRSNTSSPTVAATAAVQEDTFNITLGLATEGEFELACDTPSTGDLVATVNGIPLSENHTTICRPGGGSPVPTINLTLGASTCPDVTYLWQRRTSLTTNTWTDISGQTGLNFNNAQTQVHTTNCVTQFRRLTIFTITVCGDTITVLVPSPETFTVYNSSHFQLVGTSNVSVFDSDTNITSTFTDISSTLNNNVLVCYGNTVTINADLILGSTCDFPVPEDASASVNFSVNGLYVSDPPITALDIPGNGSINQNFSFTFQAVNNPALGIDVFGASGAVSVPVRVRITINRNGCISNRILNLLTLQIFPRAIGGEILIDPDCPDKVTNDSEVLTMTYAAEPGLGYVWEYCSDYTDTGGVLTCNDTWETIPNQFQLNMPLAALTLNNIFQPVIVRRVAQSGNNCGGAQYSNSVEVDFLQEMPDFDLPAFLCEGNIITTLPQASPVVNGTWHLVTTNSQGNSYDSNPTTQLPAGLTEGNYTYVFIPESNTLCYAPVIWNFDVLAPVDAGTLSGNTTLVSADTSQITATVPGGSWSSSDTDVATVNSSGLVTAVGTGTALITYTVPGDCPNAVSITITVVKCLDSTIWDGTAWSNGTPNTPAFLNTAVIFNDDFSTTEDLYACTVTVNNNAVVTVTHIGDEDESDEGHTVTVKHEVTVATTATLVFEDDTSLVQIENDANSGDIQYKRRTPKIAKLDYVYWSSPVSGQNLLLLSNETPLNRFYVWNPAIDNWSNTPPATTVMEAGKGYIVRGGNDIDGLKPFTANFTGVPHNGVITTPVIYNGTLNDNLIGNPYPSALDIDCFLADPDNAHLGGTILLWSHNIPIDFTGATPGNQVYNYNVNSYVPYNRLGGVGSGITAVDMLDENNEIRLVYETDRPKGKVAAGQSFFIKTGTTGVATFKNNMRVGSRNQENSQFYRSPGLPPAEASVCVTEERHRLWLQIRNITPEPQQFKQALVGYAENATTGAGLDRDYDFGIFNTAHPASVNLYSLNPGGTELLIQGRALAEPFDTGDIIPLGFSCKYLGSSGQNTIQIAPSEFDGLFETTDFWLRESLGGGVFAYHDIKTTPFEFIITADINDDTERFAIVFTNPLPRQEQTQKDGFNVVAAPNPFEAGVTFEVITQNHAPVKVQLFDLLGKLVEEGEYTVQELQTEQFGKNLSAGVYQAVITQGSHKTVQKIIKQ